MKPPDWTPCTACAACCTDIGHIKDLSDLGYVLPDGSCKNLDRETKGCRIYETRPAVCNVEAIRPPMLSEESWSMINVGACDFLHRRQYGVEREDKGPCEHKLEGE